MVIMYNYTITFKIYIIIIAYLYMCKHVCNVYIWYSGFTVLFTNNKTMFIYVTGFEKTRLSGIFYISRNTILKYSSHSGSLMPNCRDARFTA